MKVTEVRIKPSREISRLLAYCSVTLDHMLVIHDIKLVMGKDDKLFIAMPVHKVQDHCDFCMAKNSLVARYCNQCGTRLRDSRGYRGVDGFVKLYLDIVHPIHNGLRLEIENRIISEYQEMKETRIN